MLRMRGMSLVEMVITIVIISVALVASLRAFSVLTGRSADVLIQTRSVDLAQLYFDEILSRRYDEATGTNGVPAYTGACRITDDDRGINAKTRQLRLEVRTVKRTWELLCDQVIFVHDWDARIDLRGFAADVEIAQ